MESTKKIQKKLHRFLLEFLKKKTCPSVPNVYFAVTTVGCDKKVILNPWNYLLFSGNSVWNFTAAGVEILCNLL